MAEHADRDLPQRARNDSNAFTRGAKRDRAEVMAAFARSPVLDEARLRSDLDAAIGQDLLDREW
ncbi:hypothetical protein ONA91_07200 [Micromonospora sp. DR5-3]|uniref:hypothetical protein n=1 Tax=unclassified Micromonospora TaxID=2617518 RepID=UPI0011E62D4B|nr:MULTISPECIES: hypothetical protein [unclassified Micromonospora]MCW3814242.1 hypothetical protein [Micromonospora sp. DR5-3]